MDLMRCSQAHQQVSWQHTAVAREVSVLSVSPTQGIQLPIVKHRTSNLLKCKPWRGMKGSCVPPEGIVDRASISQLGVKRRGSCTSGFTIVMSKCNACPPLEPLRMKLEREKQTMVGPCISRVSNKAPPTLITASTSRHVLTIVTVSTNSKSRRRSR